MPKPSAVQKEPTASERVQQAEADLVAAEAKLAEAQAAHVAAKQAAARGGSFELVLESSYAAHEAQLALDVATDRLRLARDLEVLVGEQSKREACQSDAAALRATAGPLLENAERIDALLAELRTLIDERRAIVDANRARMGRLVEQLHGVAMMTSALVDAVIAPNQAIDGIGEPVVMAVHCALRGTPGERLFNLGGPIYEKTVLDATRSAVGVQLNQLRRVTRRVLDD